MVSFLLTSQRDDSIVQRLFYHTFIMKILHHSRYWIVPAYAYRDEGARDRQHHCDGFIQCTDLSPMRTHALPHVVALTMVYAPKAHQLLSLFFSLLFIEPMIMEADVCCEWPPHTNTIIIKRTVGTETVVVGYYYWCCCFLRLLGTTHVWDT